MIRGRAGDYNWVRLHQSEEDKMEEGREYTEGSPFCNPVGPTVVPVVVARLCEAKSTCLVPGCCLWPPSRGWALW